MHCTKVQLLQNRGTQQKHVQRGTPLKQSSSWKEERHTNSFLQVLNKLHHRSHLLHLQVLNKLQLLVNLARSQRE
ncbi:hypothetical protein QN277_024646 [Acacia crassicarpa]|uniref:Uncharacterized protein n=1 Tax=Acacia crassicarpa TaxID=499986 RepID=A0AAE1JGF6_9FABA|nr:hypothetical protein QN277_024646 [Acacia crassicarpa]